MNEALRATLARHGIAGEAAQWQRLTGGYHNDVYRVRDGDIDVVMKHYVAPSGNPMFPQLPIDEHRALRHLAGTGLAPDPVAFFDEVDGHPALVYRFVPGSAWQTGVGSIAVLLAAVHGLEAGSHWRAGVSAGADALAHAHSMIDTCPPSEERRRLGQLLTEMGGTTTSPGAATTLVHTDCGPGNVIMATHGAVLIDWQCPALGDPIEDLANFCSPAIQILYDRAPLTTSEEIELIERYGAVHPATADRWPSARWVFHGRLAAYCCVRRSELREREPEVSARYARALAAELDLIGHGGPTT